MVKPNETPDKDKLAIILEAARKRFGHYGIHKTTMTEIADDIGMSKASLYYYFPDKEHLFTGVLEKEMESFFAQMQNVMAASLPASEKLKHYVDERYAFFLQFLNLSKLTLAAADSLKPFMGTLHEDFRKHENEIIESILQLGVRKKEFVTMDTHATAALFVNMMLGLRMAIIKQRDSYQLTKEDYETLHVNQATITDIFIKGISRIKK